MFDRFDRMLCRRMDSDRGVCLGVVVQDKRFLQHMSSSPFLLIDYLVRNKVVVFVPFNEAHFPGVVTDERTRLPRSFVGSDYDTCYSVAKEIQKQSSFPCPSHSLELLVFAIMLRLCGVAVIPFSGYLSRIEEMEDNRAVDILRSSENSFSKDVVWATEVIEKRNVKKAKKIEELLSSRMLSSQKYMIIDGLGNAGTCKMLGITTVNIMPSDAYPEFLLKFHPTLIQKLRVSDERDGGASFIHDQGAVRKVDWISRENAVEYTDEGNKNAKVRAYKAALPFYEFAVAQDPGYARAWYNKAIMHEWLCQMGEAYEAFLKVLKIDPNYQKARVELMKIEKRFVTALRVFVSAVEALPPSPERALFSGLFSPRNGRVLGDPCGTNDNEAAAAARLNRIG
ncbi:MAG TPA: tetratricopeptide repeat protein [Gammaproteobacteria bacterium]|nr:tetratricopeptide repeat protein [Gammaproteobacteria bacterium]